MSESAVVERLKDCYGVQLEVLRLDKIHPEAPGNKWFKLQPNLNEAKRQGAKTLVSFGGAWSNHLHALAALGYSRSFKTLGFVRGAASEPLNACLQDAENWGMKLEFLSFGDYRRRHDPGFVAELIQDIEAPFFIPEGGANKAAAEACADIAGFIPQAGTAYDAILLACGTATTLVGLVLGLSRDARIIGVPVVKNAHYLEQDITQLLNECGVQAQNWALDFRISHMGFGRMDEGLKAFVHRFEASQSLQLDPIYTAKLFYLVEQMCESGEFSPGQRLLLLHTGGLQGRRGYPEVFPES